MAFNQNRKGFEVVIDQNTFLHLLVFKASKGHYISSGCEKILEILERRRLYFRGQFWKILRGGGVMRQIPSVGVVWILSGTTHYKSNLFQKKLEGEFISVYFFCLLVDHGPITGRAYMLGGL